jgi:hypothetical protein
MPVALVKVTLIVPLKGTLGEQPCAAQRYEIPSTAGLRTNGEGACGSLATNNRNVVADSAVVKVGGR